MSLKIEESTKQVLALCSSYEKYKEQLKYVYWNLLVVTGYENSLQPRNIPKEWNVEMFRNRSKNEQKSMIILQGFDALRQTHWIKHKPVIGEEQLYREIKPLFEAASKVEYEQQANIRRCLSIFYEFYHSGYEKVKAEFEEVSKATIQIEHGPPTSPDWEKNYAKSCFRFNNSKNKIMKMVSNLDETQLIHLRAIRDILNALKVVNTTYSQSFKPMESIPKKKYSHDQAKVLKLAKEKKKKEAGSPKT